jgi:hypothetical protein
MREVTHIIGRVLAFTAAALLSVSSALYVPIAHAAGSASFEFSPASGSYQKGATLSVTVNVNPAGSNVNAVQADISFPTAQLAYVSTSFTGSAFDIAVVSQASGGTISIARGVSGGNSISATSKLATITFTVVGQSGTASLAMLNSSAIVDTGSNNVWNEATAGASYTLAPAPAPASPSTGGAKPATPNQAATPSSGVPTEAETQANAALNDDQPVPVSVYDDQTGYLVSVTVLDSKGKGVAGTEVSLDDQKATTNSEGVASFTNVRAGERTVSVLGTSRTIQVSTGEPADVQAFTISLREETSRLWLYVAVAAVIVVAATLLFMLRNRPWQKSKANVPMTSVPDISTAPPSSSPTMSSEPKVITPSSTPENSPDNTEKRP